MPADRSLGEDLAATLTETYTGIESRMVSIITKLLAKGIDLPDWADQRLSDAADLRKQAVRLVELLNSGLGSQVEQILLLAYQRGATEAQKEIERLTDMPTPPVPGVTAVQALTFSTVSKLQGTHLRILRWALDSYRSVIAAAAPEVLVGNKTRRQAAQTAWDQFLSRGVTGFVDRAGRNWNLASYVEMAMRSTTAQAAVQGHLDRLQSAGIDLVIVSNAPQECSMCRPWENKVLTRSGSGRRTVEVEHATDDRVISVQVAGSVSDAVQAGLMHPNCKHSISAFLPGVTKRTTHTSDPQGDADRQRLRALERMVRQWKMREVGALSPEANSKASAKIRYWQGEVRQHIRRTGLLRQNAREQIGIAR